MKFEKKEKCKKTINRSYTGTAAKSPDRSVQRGGHLPVLYDQVYTSWVKDCDGLGGRRGRI